MRFPVLIQRRDQCYLPSGFLHPQYLGLWCRFLYQTTLQTFSGLVVSERQPRLDARIRVRSQKSPDSGCKCTLSSLHPNRNQVSVKLYSIDSGPPQSCLRRDVVLLSTTRAMTLLVLLQRHYDVRSSIVSSSLYCESLPR